MNDFKQTRDLINHFLKYINGEVGDIGAGGAKYKEIILKKASSYVAFDVVEGKNIDVVGDILNMPFRDESFDTVISTQVMEHVEKPWIMVRELKRILRVNGSCLLTVPFLISYHPDPTDFFRYTKEGVISLFKNEGFKIIEVGTYNRLFSTIFEIINIAYFKEKKFKGQEKILKYLQKFSFWLDRFNKGKNIYANVYIVAKKINK